MRALPVGTAALVIGVTGCGSGAAPSSTPEKSARPLDAISTPVKAGERIGPFTVERIDVEPAQKLTIPASKDAKLTLIDFWVTWCPSSSIWFGPIETLHQQYRGRGLAVIGVSQDDEQPTSAEQVKTFAKEHGVTFPIAWDRGHALANAVHPPHWQSLVVVDREGVVKLAHVGTQKDVIDDVVQRIGALVAAAP